MDETQNYEGLNENYQSYVDWYENGRLSQYVTAKSSFGGSPFHYIEALQPAGDMSDPAVDDIVIGINLDSAIRVDCDLGAGKMSRKALPNGLFSVPPLSATSIMIQNPHKIRVIGIPHGYAKRMMGGNDGKNIDFGHLHADFFSDPWIVATMSSLWKEAQFNDDVSRLYAESCVAGILQKMNLLSHQPKTRRQHDGGLSQGALSRSIEMIAADLSDETSLEDLANEAGLTPWHFCRAFKQSTGLPPYQYLLALRMEKARHLLSFGTLPVADIAQLLGYQNSQSFARAFRRFAKISPLEYRRKRSL
jgi:AraC family transcriptional regulator